jgi:hypothetical protein
MMTRMTANVLPAGGLSSGTPQTLDRLCECTGPKATKHGFIARAHAQSIAQVFENSKGCGSFTLMSEGRGPLAPEW